MCTKTPNQEFQSEAHPGFCEQASYTPPEPAFYLALGNGFLESLIRYPEEVAAHRFNIVEELHQQLGPVVSEEIESYYSTFMRLATVLTDPSRSVIERLGWLEQFMTTNNQSACDAVQVATRTIIASSVGADYHSDVYDFAQAPTHCQVYLSHFCEFLKVHCLYTSSTEAAESYGNSRHPAIYLHKDSLGHFSLLYHSEHISQRNGEHVDLHAFPFVTEDSSSRSQLLEDLIEAFARFFTDDLPKDALARQVKEAAAALPQINTNALCRLVEKLEQCGHSNATMYTPNCGIKHCVECLQDKLKEDSFVCPCGVQMKLTNIDEIRHIRLIKLRELPPLPQLPQKEFPGKPSTNLPPLFSAITVQPQFTMPELPQQTVTTNPISDERETQEEHKEELPVVLSDNCEVTSEIIDELPPIEVSEPPPEEFQPPSDPPESEQIHENHETLPVVCSLCSTDQRDKKFELVACSDHEMCKDCRLSDPELSNCPVCERPYSNMEIEMLRIIARSAQQAIVVKTVPGSFWCVKCSNNLPKSCRVSCSNRCRGCTMCALKNHGLCPHCNTPIRLICRLCNHHFSYDETSIEDCGHIVHQLCKGENCPQCN